MTTSRIRLLVLAVGLLAAAPASAATLTVYAKMAGPNAVGLVVTAAGSDPSAAITCATNSPAGCVDSSVTGTVVLEPGTAAPISNATFVGWSGCTSVAGQQCTVDMASSRTVQANFRATSQDLTVKTYPVQTATFTPPFGGTLAAPTTPAIALCKTGSPTSGNCTGAAAYNTDVVVTATPDSVSKVESWSGCKSSTATTCTVSMNAARIVSATFASKYAVTLAGQVSGPGRIAIAGSATVDGMACTTAPGADCTAGVPGTSSVTVTATPDAGAKFVLWGGLCSTATTTTCTITAAQLGNAALSKVISATFKSDSCGSCHSKPVSHAPYAANCGGCHGGYTASTINPTDHMNSVVNTAPLSCEQPPSAFAVSFEIVGSGLVVNPGAADDTAYVDAIVRFNGTPTDVLASFSPNQWGTSGAPRFSVGEVLADGSFKSVLIGSATNTNNAGRLVTSQTSTAAMWALQDATTSTYRFTFSAAGTSGVRTVEGLDPTKAYRAVMYGARYFTPAANPPLTCATTQFPTSDYFDFSPTGTESAFKATVTDPKCNACHGALNLHGRRRGVAICLTCHNPNTPLGTGNTDAFKWDLKNIAHKFHSGLNYDGINPMTGVQGSAWGTTLDATGVAQGPSHQTYFEGGGTATASSTLDDAVHQLPTQMQCVICHDTAKDDHLVASQAGCSSCHPINWATGAGHGSTYPVALEGETLHPHTDAECAGCHPKTGRIDTVWDATPAQYPVKEIHSTLWEPITGYDFNLYFAADGTTKLDTVNFSGNLYPGVPEGRHQLDVTVDDFTVDGTSGKATIYFTVTFDGAPYSDLVDARTAALTGPSSTNPTAPDNTFASNETLGGRWPTCAFTLAGPAGSDYVIPATGSNNLSCGAQNLTDGTQIQPDDAAGGAAAGKYKFTPSTVLNAAAYPPGTYTLSYEMMYQRQAGDFDGTSGNADDAIARKPFAVKPKFYSVVKTGTATAGSYAFSAGSPRRAVVAFDKCNACHVQIGFHSNQSRQGPDYCAVCHNPKLENGGRDRVTYAAARDYTDYLGYTTATSGKVYLTESVSMNVFIHRIHMGAELPSVQNAALASPWVPEPGRIFYGATRSAFVGVTATTPPEITDLSEFEMPNPMGRCNACHLDGTWATPETARAPVERSFRECVSTTPSWATEPWCNNTSTSGPAKRGILVTPPVKAVCTSCHDDIATDTHADAMTTNPMTATAVEQCADCHGAGATWDAIKVHPPIP